MLLAQKQKYTPMEQGRKSRDKLTHLWLCPLRQRRQKYTMEKRQSLHFFTRSGAEKLDSHVKKTPCRKINSSGLNLNVRPNSIRHLEENTGRTLLDINCSNIFFDPWWSRLMLEKWVQSLVGEQ